MTDDTKLCDAFRSALIVDDTGDLKAAKTIYDLALDKQALVDAGAVDFLDVSQDIQKFLIDHDVKLDSYYKVIGHARHKASRKDTGSPLRSYSLLMLLCTCAYEVPMFHTALLLLQASVKVNYENKAGENALSLLISNGYANIKKMTDAKKKDLKQTIVLLVRNGAITPLVRNGIVAPQLPLPQLRFFNAVLSEYNLVPVAASDEQILDDHFLGGIGKVRIGDREISFTLRYADGEILLVKQK